jgi:putative sterol carrier protein
MASTSTLDQWKAVRGRAPGLAGLSCGLELYVANACAGSLLIEESGEVRIVDECKASGLIAADSQDTLIELLRGDLPPIVAHLQGRLRFEGDADLALRVLFGLQEGSPWAATLPATGAVS